MARSSSVMMMTMSGRSDTSALHSAREPGEHARRTAWPSRGDDDAFGEPGRGRGPISTLLVRVTTVRRPSRAQSPAVGDLSHPLGQALDVVCQPMAGSNWVIVSTKTLRPIARDGRCRAVRRRGQESACTSGRLVGPRADRPKVRKNVPDLMRRAVICRVRLMSATVSTLRASLTQPKGANDEENG